MRLRRGVKVGPYEVMDPLGAGGMAEVYRARDTRLGREIALKVVNEVLSGDPELVRRFEQEARLAGSLNHPNLVSVYDFGVHEGVPYFVTELLEGESLRHRLAGGRIPLGTALDFAAQMASGLAAAHGKGVVHRDVKPDNVFVTTDGKAKLLDFGIAKLAAGAAPGGAHGLMDDTVTPTGGATATGAVLGTPGYMSPEQVRGEPLDARSDLFSLGAVLHEMLSGHRAFQGKSLVESGYSILHADPEPLPPQVPVSVAQVVQRCLQKEPARRFQSASDLAFALEVLRSPTGPPVSTGATAPKSRARALRWLAFLAVGLALLGGGALLVQNGRRAAQLPELEQVTFRWGAIGAARFLHDGRVAFSAAFEGRPEELFVRPPKSTAAQALGVPDARLVAVSGADELAILLHPRGLYTFVPPGTLARLPSVGGVPRELEENVEQAAWSPRGDLALVRSGGDDRTLEFPAGRALLRMGGWISHPRFAPGGEALAFLHHPVPDDDQGEVVVADLEGNTRTLSARYETIWGLAWSSDGREIWFTAGTVQRDTLLSVDLSSRTREIYRSIGRITLEDVAADGEVLLRALLSRGEVVAAGSKGEASALSWSDTIDSAGAVSDDGKVLFSFLQRDPASGREVEMVALRAIDGSPAQVLGEGLALDLSSDRRWALAVTDEGRSLVALPTGAGHVRPIDLRGFRVRAHSAGWFPDGTAVLVGARAPSDDRVRLYRIALDGSAPTRVSDLPLSPNAFVHVAPDGRQAAVLDDALRLRLISLGDGTNRTMPTAPSAVPRGWSASGDLWVTEAEERTTVSHRLLRLDVRSGRTLEERIIRPADSTGVTQLYDVALSPEGKHLVFAYGRDLGTLYIARGLGR